MQLNMIIKHKKDIQIFCFNLMLYFILNFYIHIIINIYLRKEYFHWAANIYLRIKFKKFQLIVRKEIK